MFCNSGSQGWGYATDAALNPVLYSSNAAVGMRFAPLAPSTIARMYHSTANLLPVSVWPNHPTHDDEISDSVSAGP
jgi:hypothetical protein